MAELEDSTNEREFYQELIQEILNQQINSLGEKAALTKARRAPVTIGTKGQVMNFYGQGDDVLLMLASEYEEVWGKSIARMKLKNIFKKKVSQDKRELLPEELRP